MPDGVGGNGDRLLCRVVLVLWVLGDVPNAQSVTLCGEVEGVAASGPVHCELMTPSPMPLRERRHRVRLGPHANVRIIEDLGKHRDQGGEIKVGRGDIGRGVRSHDQREHRGELADIEALYGTPGEASLVKETDRIVPAYKTMLDSLLASAKALGSVKTLTRTNYANL